MCSVFSSTGCEELRELDRLHRAVCVANVRIKGRKRRDVALVAPHGRIGRSGLTRQIEGGRIVEVDVVLRRLAAHVLIGCG
jgi:invasion protein IalB